MENTTETHNKSESTNNANSPVHYKIIVLGIFIGIIGIFLRFVNDSELVGIVANGIFIVGIIICLKAVLDILK